MIKLLAALLMLIDHIGVVLFPQAVWLRIIGRLSMPLFAYCIARGFYCTKQNGTTGKYAIRLLALAVVSQIPYTVMCFRVFGSFSLNICFTWVLAVCFLAGVEALRKYPILATLTLTVITAVAAVSPVDYGLYGVLFPSVFYLFLFRRNRPIYAFAGMTALYALYAIANGATIQIFSLVACAVLLLARHYDDKIKLPRRFFYWFYPAHLAVLLVCRAIF